MEKKQIEIRLINSWLEDEIVTLYKIGGWWKDSYDTTEISQLIKGSFVFAIAIDKRNGNAIGMGRAISDGISDAYIQDVVIQPSYRGKNVGKKIVQVLVNYCISKGIQWIGLVAEPGSKNFYINLGFKPMEDFVPMLYSRGNNL